MIQCRGGLRFALESRQRLRVFGYIIRQEFESDEAMQLYILGFVHHTHPAPAQFLHDAVMRDGLSDHGLKS